MAVCFASPIHLHERKADVKAHKPIMGVSLRNELYQQRAVRSAKSVLEFRENSGSFDIKVIV
jgi:hypothetical protein